MSGANDHERSSDPERPEEPGQAQQPGRAGAAPGDRPGRRHPWLTAIVVFLLITIPAGYLVISALQSRDSGEEKQENASATGLTEDWPSKVQRRIYDVWIPPWSREVAYYETNSWKTSTMYVQFLTSPEGVDRYLKDTLHTDSRALVDGKVPVNEAEEKAAGWRLDRGEGWSGLTVDQKDPEPTVDVAVQWVDARHRMVYIVSTITP
ncbi:sugar kinase [Streptomyces sp. XD-27]|uniref:sugar kinase n=1 Tax=Streptomyces sp. XD-27 TaxID=3062779 RepID=UPI0026F47D6D|nr:sugar kinase [Streptomyces sp. XD-27]WKX73191.1 sugar kinase [Streptomyces sp. XD-27]